MRWLTVPAVFAALGMAVPMSLSLAALATAWAIRTIGIAPTVFAVAFVTVGALAS